MLLTGLTLCGIKHFAVSFSGQDSQAASTSSILVTLEMVLPSHMDVNQDVVTLDLMDNEMKLTMNTTFPQFFTKYSTSDDWGPRWNGKDINESKKERLRLKDVSMEVKKRQEGLKRFEEGQGTSGRMVEMEAGCKKLEREIRQLRVKKDRVQGKFEKEQTQMIKYKKVYNIQKKCIQQLKAEVEQSNVMTGDMATRMVMTTLTRPEEQELTHEFIKMASTEPKPTLAHLSKVISTVGMIKVLIY